MANKKRERDAARTGSDPMGDDILRETDPLRSPQHTLNPEPGASIGATASGVAARAAEEFDREQSAVQNVYRKTAEAVRSSVSRSQDFVQEYPFSMTLAAFGAGLGLGILLFSLFRSRSSRWEEQYPDYSV